MVSQTQPEVISEIWHSVSTEHTRVPNPKPHQKNIQSWYTSSIQKNYLKQEVPISSIRFKLLPQAIHNFHLLARLVLKDSKQTAKI